MDEMDQWVVFVCLNCDCVVGALSRDNKTFALSKQALSLLAVDLTSHNRTFVSISIPFHADIDSVPIEEKTCLKTCEKIEERVRLLIASEKAKTENKIKAFQIREEQKFDRWRDDISVQSERLCFRLHKAVSSQSQILSKMPQLLPSMGQVNDSVLDELNEENCRIDDDELFFSLDEDNMKSSNHKFIKDFAFVSEIRKSDPETKIPMSLPISIPQNLRSPANLVKDQGPSTPPHILNDVSYWSVRIPRSVRTKEMESFPASLI